MKSAKKLLALFLAVIMLFSVMSVGMVAFAASVTIDGAADDTYNTTDDVVIVVPETVYLNPGDGESTTGQYFVNNTVDATGKVTLAAEKANTRGYIGIYAPGATAFSFTADAVAGSGIGDPVIHYSEDINWLFEGTRYNNTDVGGSTGYAAYPYLDLYLNGRGLTAGNTALVEWKVTVYYGDADTTGTTYYAYTTLYMPGRSVGAVAESRMTSDKNNEISSWISGVTGTGSRTSVSSDRVVDGGTTADGYLTYDPLWTYTFGVGSSQNAEDYVTPSDTIRTAHAVAVNGDQWTRSVGYLGYLAIDSSRYTNTNQIPNFYIGSDVLRIEDRYPNNSLESHNVWYTMGPIMQVDQTKQEPIPEGWDQHPVDYDGDGKEYRWSTSPSYAVSDVDGKYIHVASQAHCLNVTTTNFANAYVSVQFSVTDKSDLRAAVIQATSLDETNYTKNSWSGATANIIEEFHDALRDAAQVLGTPGVSQSTIDSALNNLNSKKNALMVTIKFDAATNGGVFTDSETVKEYSVRFGTATEVTLGAAMLNYFSAVKANGYELAGWSTDPNDPASASLSSVKVTFGDTLYAHYKKTISVDFNFLKDAKGNTDVVSNDLTIYNQEDKALNVNVEDADDVGIYKFAGWTQDPASTEGAELGDTLEGVTSSTNYYATYVKELKLTLDANGGDFDVDSVTGGVGYNYNLTQSTGDAIVTLPEEEPVKTGFGFKGWDIGGTVYQPGDEVTFSGNTTEATATAVWGPETYDVTFNYKDANGNDVSITEEIEYGNAAVAPDAPAYYADSTMHHEFTGWDVSFDNITGDTVVTAQYAAGVMHSYSTTGSYPTCEEAGEVVYTCSVCGYSYTYSSDALGHNYVNIDSKDATCEEDGYIVWQCSRDNSHTYTEILKATGHSFENTNYVDSTCTQDGYYISGTCEYCGEDLAGKIIPAKGHDYKIVDSKKATCEEDGYEKYECSRCDSSYTKTLEKTGHDYIIITEKAPTCTEDGYESINCSICGFLHNVRLPATGHSYVSIIFPPTCTATGYTSLTCMVCGTATKTDEVPALGHDFVDVVVAPTCTAQGYTKHTCSVCGYSYKTDYVDALGHFFNTETVVPPTCTKRGYTLHECGRCDSSYKTDYVDATGHEYELIETVLPGITTNGYHLYECSKCKHTYKETIYADGKALVCFTLYDGDGKVVPNATLTITQQESGEQIVITTDDNGYFTYIFPEGTYSVTITKMGYDDITGIIEVVDGESAVDIPAMPHVDCSCLCHADSFWGQIYRLLIKMFSIFGKIYCCDDSEIW